MPRRNGYAATPASDKSGPDHAEVLWKTIGRFDTYAGTTNTKAGVVLTFDSFAVTALALKASDIIGQFEKYPIATVWVAGLLALVTISSLLSMAYAFAAISPYLRSPKAPGKYHSILFFEHVAEYASDGDYLEALKRHDEEGLLVELSTQARAVAIGLRGKFRLLRKSVWVVLVGVLIPMALIVATRFVVLLFFNS